MASMTRRFPRSTAAGACALLAPCGTGSDGGGGTCEPSAADNPCDLAPGGEIADGCFAGTFTFGGDAAFPLSLVVDAAASRFDGELAFVDAGASYRGRAGGAIDGRGRLCGEFSAEPEGGGPRVRGRFRGATDGRRACGVWDNEFDRRGSWRAERAASCQEAAIEARCPGAPPRTGDGARDGDEAGASRTASDAGAAGPRGTSPEGPGGSDGDVDDGVGAGEPTGDADADTPPPESPTVATDTPPPAVVTCPVVR